MKQGLQKYMPRWLLKTVYRAQTGERGHPYHLPFLYNSQTVSMMSIEQCIFTAYNALNTIIIPTEDIHSIFRSCLMQQWIVWSN